MAAARILIVEDEAIVAESIRAVYAAREQTKGLKMVYEPEYLRFFQARFEPIE